ncbi:hypothetical protein BAUCODRAFT_36668 [Baudoinia panamericana UAMH 10762]|uniref:Uncharacterized protein n=1 Tax=Baudoinia panamericana (strain UAMH 10762) TaxID=717646 RepID=M2LJ06_BAUPA|nr:uncharacterized protein BAUCODRAFT_36668 [Baudoinia panamericana UAMH 10762]EMC94197.1 hypothetical protein BAUCODRAFT_36668 [Baudoinia panamericana UAMH 10762]
MPHVRSRNPSWLARPSPASRLFEQHDRSSPAHQHDEGPSRRLAHRGTELFVAVGNELRWSDLVSLKASGEAPPAHPEAPYRTLKTSVARPIRQLSVSPSGDCIAIATTHTCHVALLPSSSHLHSGDYTPLRLKTFQLGPTAHVLEQAPLISLLWHPLSPTGNALVTLTQDACIRLWELDRSNRSTFDEPSLAVDLKKLANATSTQADFSASKYGTSVAFSPDNVEMQAAAACFGGRGAEDEHGWASMTLWVAMTEGDVYALCPFLPTKWRAPVTLLPSLSTSVVARQRAVGASEEATESERRVVEQQCAWLADLDAQDPILLAVGDSEYDYDEVYNRPERPGAVAKLQGPFYVGPDLDSGDITDIHVIAPKLDNDAVYDEEYEMLDPGESGLSVGIVCLLTSKGKVQVCLDIDVVEAEWLPAKRSRTFTPDDEDDDKELLLFHTVELCNTEDREESWPTFTPSPLDRYEVFATTKSGINTLDFNPWINMLEDELSSSADEGIDFRLGALLASATTSVNNMVSIPSYDGAKHLDLNAALAIYDPANVGYMLLTLTNGTSHSALLDLPLPASHPYAPDTTDMTAALPAPETQAPYQPAEVFLQPSALPQLIRSANDKRLLGSDLKAAAVRFSPATLQLMTEAHRILSEETHRLGQAAAELFRRCERMQRELREQVKRVGEVGERVERAISGGDDDDDDDDEEGEGGQAVDMRDGRLALRVTDHVDQRVEDARHKTEELHDRVDRLGARMRALGGRKLSTQERGFAEEVERIRHSISLSTTAGVEAAPPTEPGALLRLENSAADLAAHEQEAGRERGGEHAEAGSLVGRLESVRALHEQLLQEAGEVVARLEKGGDGRGDGDGAMGMTEFRRKKMKQVQGLVERETAMLQGVVGRLARLSTG